jgi:nucleotide-binding universal stress UspA family protein
MLALRTAGRIRETTVHKDFGAWASIERRIAKMGYQKILVALDRSSHSETVLEEAIALAQQNGAQLMIFHRLEVNEPDAYGYSDLHASNIVRYSQIMQERLESELDHIRSWLDTCVRRAADQNLTASWNWKIGDAGRCICQMAKDFGADLIVVGRRGHQGVIEALLGSVSNFVVHRAPCSVLVVQSRE